MIKVLVTGSSGMIGFHLLKVLSNHKQYQLYAMDKYNIEKKNILSDTTYCFERTQFLKEHNPDIYFCNINLCDNLIFEKIADIQPDIIIHLAADAGISESFKNPQKILWNNNNSFINLLEAIRTIKPDTKLLYASSSSVYGKTHEFQVESNKTLCPTSSYGLSKLMNEQTAELYFQNYGISSVGLRFFTVYGEYNRKDMLMHYLLESFSHQKEVKLYNNGLMQRDFTYAGDVVQAIMAFIDCNTISQHEIFNIGGTGSASLNDVVFTMSQYFKSFPNIIQENFIPPYDPLKTFCNNSKLLHKFPDLKFTSLNDGILKLVKWYNDTH